MNTLAPIVLFVYNRPEHTRRTLESLMKNTLADHSELKIYADGPKQNASHEEIKKIKTVRQIIKEKKWCKEVQIIESEINKGLAKSIIEGVTETVTQYGKVIVLEDDLELSAGFLQYMNDALNIYQDEDKVMHISGYMFPVKAKLPETFFYNATSCWGWATWKRAWRSFNPNAEALLKQIICNKLEESFNSQFPYSLAHLEANAKGSLNTWAIKWHACIFLNNGFCLHPSHSLVQNIGNDSTGVNSVKTDVFFHKKMTDHISVSKMEIVESERALKAMRRFYRVQNKRNLVSRIKELIRSRLVKSV